MVPLRLRAVTQPSFSALGRNVVPGRSVQGRIASPAVQAPASRAAPPRLLADDWAEVVVDCFATALKIDRCGQLGR